MTKSNLRRKGFISSYSSQVILHQEGSEGRKAEQKLEEGYKSGTMEEYYVLAWFQGSLSMLSENIDGPLHINHQPRKLNKKPYRLIW